MNLKDLNLSKDSIKQALSAQTDYTLTIKSEAHYVVQVLSDEGMGILNIYFKNNKKVSFLCQGEKTATAQKFAMKLVNDINMGVAA